MVLCLLVVLLSAEKHICPLAEQRIVFMVFGAVYALLALVALVQLIRVAVYTHQSKKCGSPLLVVAHLCVLFASLVRGGVSFVRTESDMVDQVPVGAIAFLTSLPFVLEFLGFSFVAFTWYAVVFLVSLAASKLRMLSVSAGLVCITLPCRAAARVVS